jgi:predicted  nucleic acid-binding Zn-ribbon protein
VSNNALSNAYAELDELRKAYHVLQAENAELKSQVSALKGR